MFCPKCKAEYNPGITKCADCDVPLVDKLPEERKEKTSLKQTHKDTKFEEVIVTFNQGEIAFIRSLLDDAGIEYYFKGDYSNVHLWADPMRLMVRDDQVEKTIKILKKLDFGSSGLRNEQKETE